MSYGPTDHKEAFNEAHYAAIEDGCSEDEAVKKGEAASQHFAENLLDAADNLRKEIRENGR